MRLRTPVRFRSGALSSVSRGDPIGPGATVAVAAIAASTPGLLVAGLLLILGVEHGIRSLVWVAAAFLAWFVGFYYYDLDLTLLAKSYVLIGTGLVLLATRWLATRWSGHGAQATGT